MKKINKYGRICLCFGLLLIAASKISAQKTTTKYNFNNISRQDVKALYDSRKGAVGGKPAPVGDKAADRMNYEFELLKDPNTGKIPNNIREKEINFSRKIPKGNLLKGSLNKSSKKTSGAIGEWVARGPGNVGGRTRALALDLMDENIILAGGVSGGLWRSTDAGQNWTRVTKPDQNPSITAITQDPRPGHNNTWYYATGETIGNSASGNEAIFRGTGVYKSINNGVDWSQIENTTDGSVTNITEPDYMSSIAVDPTNGDVYVATLNSVFRLKEGNINNMFVGLILKPQNALSEIAITPLGKIYATFNKNGATQGGILVSDDGDTWTDITPTDLSTANYGRTVIAIDPQNENTVWFLSVNQSNNQGLLWRYQADATPGTEWENRTSGLPNTTGGFAWLNTQFGFNMLIKVHPTNSNIVFVGGTNLHRSIDGFTTPVGNSGWIGGYNKSGKEEAYTNHHADQHNLVLLPSNPSIAISANDGGLFRTENILAQSVSYTSLNNNYLTTQPFTLSFDTEGTNTTLLSGFQDNGTWVSGSDAITDPWAEMFSGDGSYNAVADGAQTLYVSTQYGNLHRLNFDENFNYVSSARITMDQNKGFAFLAPFVLDPNDDNIMYMPSAGSMWANSNLDEIPTGSSDNAKKNWHKYDKKALGTPITAVDASTYPVQHRIYFGAQGGGIFRADNAHTKNPIISLNLAKGQGLGPGQINCIYVDPTDSDRVFIVKPNYGVRSIHMSENAGATWIDISGNLEENTDGTGNGPSVRWITMIGNNDGYLVGTSTGLYGTTTLAGLNTVWTREDMNMDGNLLLQDAVVTMVKTRKDGFAAAAIHGNGLFSANYAVTPRQQPTLFNTNNIANKNISNKLGTYNIDLNNNFTSTLNSPITLEVTNSRPDLFTATATNGILYLTDIDPDIEGVAGITLTASSGSEKTATEFNITTSEFGFYNQTTTEQIVYYTRAQEDPVNTMTQRSADDFVIPEGATWTINRVKAQGSDLFTPQIETINDAQVTIFNDDNGKPGTVAYTTGLVNNLNQTESGTELDVSIPFPTEAVLQSGKYWLEVHVKLNYFPGYRAWYWANTTDIVGDEALYIAPEGDQSGLQTFPNNSKVADWTPISETDKYAGSPPRDLLFKIYGTIGTLGVEELAVLGNLVTAYPNPSSSQFTFKVNEINPVDDKLSLKIFDITGKQVYKKLNINSTEPIVWDASNYANGVYLAKIVGLHTNVIKRLVKE